MIQSIKLACIFYGQNISDIFNHANYGTVAFWTGTNGTYFGFRNIISNCALLHLFTQSDKAFAQTINMALVLF